jgi:hypothetical protein
MGLAGRCSVGVNTSTSTLSPGRAECSYNFGEGDDVGQTYPAEPYAWSTSFEDSQKLYSTIMD